MAWTGMWCRSCLSDVVESHDGRSLKCGCSEIKLASFWELNDEAIKQALDELESKIVEPAPDKAVR